MSFNPSPSPPQPLAQAWMTGSDAMGVTSLGAGVTSVGASVSGDANMGGAANLHTSTVVVGVLVRVCLCVRVHVCVRLCVRVCEFVCLRVSVRVFIVL
jgi:hypothetical protein